MSKLICSICGTPTSFSPLLLKGKGVLLESLGSNEVHYREVALSAITDESYLRISRGDTCYAILTCQACDGWFVAKAKAYYEEWSAVYPILHKPASQDIPEPIKGEFEEASLCFAVGAHRACASMCETALEALWREQKASGLLDLKNKGIISPQLYDRANEVRLWGNVAKHELAPDVVAKEDAEQLLAYVDALLNAVYVEPRRFDNLKQKRKQIERKQT